MKKGLVRGLAPVLLVHLKERLLSLTAASPSSSLASAAGVVAAVSGLGSSQSDTEPLLCRAFLENALEKEDRSHPDLGLPPPPSFPPWSFGWSKYLERVQKIFACYLVPLVAGVVEAGAGAVLAGEAAHRARALLPQQPRALDQSEVSIVIRWTNQRSVLPVPRLWAGA